MAFDRYLAICRPLYYHTVMTTITVWRLVTFVWMFPCCTAILMILMTLRFPICMNQIDKLYCETWVLERLACRVDTAQFVLSGILTCAINALVCFVFLSYIKILIACERRSGAGGGMEDQVHVEVEDLGTEAGVHTVTDQTRTQINLWELAASNRSVSGAVFHRISVDEHCIRNENDPNTY
ncbi:hypothetical protein QQF64_017710 [Cirrhinus molitorella]|uniref:G-protein coupled receptors family 1 profile domain-containing protein n=1 Tax=Cirrhinus molitorella TaxID=172907 RepID=A0ABR3LN23_9TELE